MNIYVGNLDFQVVEEELRSEFAIFGEVVSTVIMTDRYIGSGQPRGYGYVGMTSKTEGSAAIIALNGKSLKGRVIQVVEALPLSGKPGVSTTPFRVTRHPHSASRNRNWISN